MQPYYQEPFRSDYIEPGLLPTFRFLTAIRLLLTVLAYCSQSSPPSAAVLPNYPLFSLVETAVLMVYLASPWLRRLLRRFYLPAAFLIATIGPLLAHTLTIWARMANGYSGAAAFGDSGEVYLSLFIPFILLSSQYNLRTLIGYSFASIVLQISLAIPAAKGNGPPLKMTSDQAVGVTIVYILIGSMVVRFMGAQRAQRRELAQTNARLAEYANTLEQLAISRERNRMARELHDTLAHTLSAVAIQLEALDALWDGDPQAARKTLSVSRDLTRSGLLETRQALHALRSSPLQDLGLALAVRYLAETTAERSGVQLSLDISDPLNPLSPFAEQSLYRIAEEALNNAVRHADATHITVVLKQSPRTTLLMITDDGHGFDPAKAAQDGHYGLVGMRERASLCSSSLAIDSAPGNGTAIHVELENWQ